MDILEMTKNRIELNDFLGLGIVIPEITDDTDTQTQYLDELANELYERLARGDAEYQRATGLSAVEDSPDFNREVALKTKQLWVLGQLIGDVEEVTIRQSVDKIITGLAFVVSGAEIEVQVDKGRGPTFIGDKYEQYIVPLARQLDTVFQESLALIETLSSENQAKRLTAGAEVVA